VTLRARESHGAVAFDVMDEGNGITLGADIFGHGVSFGGGSGLGLALARQLAEDQGSRLLLSTRVPQTQFTLLVPIDGSAAAPIVVGHT
jgi:nitrogen-specific signal transduction histidine kinase